MNFGIDSWFPRTAPMLNIFKKSGISFNGKKPCKWNWRKILAVYSCFNNYN